MAPELSLRDTNGILRRGSTVRPMRSSAGLGWERLYVSAQSEQPYQASFDAAGTHVLILHLDGPVRVVRGEGKAAKARRIPAGGLFLHPAGRELTVELGGRLDTIHAYLSDTLLQEAAGGESPIELAEELGSADQLIEQLMLSLDSTLRQWEPSALTYLDHLSTLLAAHLARRHSVVSVVPQPIAGLSPRQFDAVRELMDQRLADPVPLAELAGAAALSVSQFARQFKVRTGESPHRFLMRLRLDQACRLLRTGTLSIAEIALRCGFSHQEHLTRVMRAQLATTPGAIRRST
ncbi:AraC family transcriptional regulator [Amycolatopsis sp.]|jgi:AraC family transcriptional regulator|uniref:AraC family transcriptional regulator n=1 Tax=Amycolatopsis sp. TaxID=37632 RepID=UPI002DF8AEDB|nr:AraC family transcriptional regulator [Amycolatopsis sp.]